MSRTLAPGGLRRKPAPVPWNQMPEETLDERVAKWNARNAQQQADIAKQQATVVRGIAKPADGKAFDPMLGKASHMVPQLRAGMAARERR